MRAKINGATLGVVAVILVLLVYLLRHVLIPFVLAAALAYILAPVVRFGQLRLRCPRWAAALLVYLLMIGGMAAWGWWAGSMVYASAPQFSGSGKPDLNRLLTRLLGDGHVTIFGYHLEAQQIATQIISRLEGALHGPQAGAIAEVAASAAVGTVMFLVLLFYFFLQGPELARGLLKLAPPEHREGIMELGAKIHPILHRYIRGLCVIVIFAGSMTWIGAGLVFHLPHAAPLAIATGLFELIPILGPSASATLLGAAAVLHGGGTWMYLGLALYWFCLRMVIDQVVGPLVLGQAVNLHPAVVIFAFIAGGVLFGLLGVLLAIPTAAALKVLLDSYYALPIED